MGKDKIGTTGRGIGPCYEDKVGRRGIRAIDLLDPKALEEKIRSNLEEKNFLLSKFFGADILEFQPIYDNYLEMADKIGPFISNVSLEIEEAARKGGKILFEGAQGTHLDIDHGTYPFVTSSNPVSGAVCTGAGVGPDKLHHIVGIVKAYTTRVGAGPFPTELMDETGVYLQEKGVEFGATTGRRRRCGWLDMVMLRDSIRYNGLTSICVTKLDVLTGLDKVRICVAYDLNGERIDHMPADLKTLAQCEPIFEEFPGWKQEISQAGNMDQLPGKTRDYLERIEKISDVPLSIVSVGPRREQTIELIDPFN
jgi:adenylosuccinate synthase